MSFHKLCRCGYPDIWLRIRGFFELTFILVTLLIAYGCEVKSKEVANASDSPEIKFNQVGYLSLAKKQAVISNPSGVGFQIMNESDEVVFTGSLLEPRFWEKSGETSSIIDFTGLNTPGKYRISYNNKISEPFTISDFPYLELLKGSSKAFYFNRAGCPITEEYAGKFARQAGHPDDQVMVHATAASTSRPKGTVIATPHGWYDAGDYNKYVVNSGISTYTLMLAYEHNAPLFDTLTWNIPESKNPIPDLLDEVLWNLQWMSSMQDPNDGGVYNKTTTASFEGFVTPVDAKSPRYVVAKGTAATLNFSAVMAKASVIYKTLNPQLANDFRESAVKAWNWALENPSVAYKNPTHTSGDPAVSTGGYGDSNFDDEFFWAAVELFLATKDSDYLSYFSIDEQAVFKVPSWKDVETLGLISLVNTEADLNEMLKKKSIDQLKMLSEQLINHWHASPYRVTINHFTWGSNSDVINQSMVLLNAYKIFGKSEFYEAALSGLDYVLGKNATGYCFVTGFGTKPPMNIHHRPSVSDTIKDPIPGFLVGGPNPNNVEDDCGKDKYPTVLPAKCYLDDVCSYSTNEVTINWNAPLVYVLGSVQMLYQTDFSN